MGEHVEALVTKLRAEAAHLQARLNAVSLSGWETTVYSEGQIWRVRDVLAHLVAAERGHQRILASVAAGGEGASPHLDIDLYNRQTVDELAECSAPALLADFNAVREETIAMVAALADEDLLRSGRHPVLGENALLADMIRLIPMHVRMHLRDLNRILR